MDLDSMFRGTPSFRGACPVQIDGKPLFKFQNEMNHSPDGFSWGYGGSGPAQLAYAILRVTTRRMFENQDAKSRFWATFLHQKFKWEIVAKLPSAKEWVMSMAYVAEWIGNNNIEVNKEWEDLQASEGCQ